MSTIVRIALWVVIGFLSLFALGFILPGHVHVERQITIQANPDRVFALVGDLEQWNAWSPWVKIDPNADMQISGSGIGQTMVWSSQHPQVGSGSQEITALEEPRYLRTHLEFDGQGQADATIAIGPLEDMTRVTWSLDTDVRKGVPLLLKPVSAYFGLLMDSTVGRSYETGLRNLKTVIEQG